MIQPINPETTSSSEENRTEKNSLPHTGYLAQIIHLNQAALPLEQLVFHYEPGMGFNDSGKWWGDKARRSTPHEGLDILYLKNRSGTIIRLKEGAPIPALADGTLMHTADDFHGQTLFVGHLDLRQGKNILFSIYAHTMTDLRRGTPVKMGEKIAAISTISGTNTPPGHLHLSMAWLPADSPRHLFNWGALCGPMRRSLIDPMPFLD